ncbi:MAG: hypothetical protein ACLQVY_07380 [Limisphaerales bacterium]
MAKTLPSRSVPGADDPLQNHDSWLSAQLALKRHLVDATNVRAGMEGVLQRYSDLSQTSGGKSRWTKPLLRRKLPS